MFQLFTYLIFIVRVVLVAPYRADHLHDSSKHKVLANVFEPIFDEITTDFPTIITGKSGKKEGTITETRKLLPADDENDVNSLERRRTEDTDTRSQWDGTMAKQVKRSRESIATSMKTFNVKSVTRPMGLSMNSLKQIKAREMKKSVTPSITLPEEMNGISVTRSMGLIATSLGEMKAKSMKRSNDRFLGEWAEAKRMTGSKKRSRTGQIPDDGTFGKRMSFTGKLATMTQAMADKYSTISFMGSSNLRLKVRLTKRARASSTLPWNCNVSDYDQGYYCPPRTRRVEHVTLSSCVPLYVQDPVTRWFLKMTTTHRDKVTDLQFK